MRERSKDVSYYVRPWVSPFKYQILTLEWNPSFSLQFVMFISVMPPKWWSWKWVNGQNHQLRWLKSRDLIWIFFSYQVFFHSVQQQIRTNWYAMIVFKTTSPTSFRTNFFVSWFKCFLDSNGSLGVPTLWHNHAVFFATSMNVSRHFCTVQHRVMMYFLGAVFLSKPLMDHAMVRLLMMIILMSCVCLMWLCYFLPYSITVKSPFRRSEEKTFYNFSQPSNHARWSWLSSWCWLIQLDGINQFSNVLKGNRSPVIEWQFVFFR